MKWATAWIEDHRRLLPRFIRRPLLRVSSGAILFVLLLLVAIALLLVVRLAAGTRDEPANPLPTASVSARPSPAPAVVAPVPSDHRSTEALQRAEKEHKAGNWAGVVVALEEALSADPAAKNDDRLATLLGEAVRRSASSNAAFRLLTGAMGEKGAVVLYDVAASPKTTNEVRVKAEEWLASEQFQRVAPPEVLIAGQLRTARGCKEKHGLLPTAGATGDRRALEYLKVLAVNGGCGRRGRDDCFPCLRDDDALSNAIAKLEQRSAATAKSP